MTITNRHMRMAVQADLDNLYRRLPDPKHLGNQLREMLQAESRAARYGLVPPWRTKGDWYGVVVPNTSDEVDESAIVTTRPTGRKAGRQKER